MDNDPNSRSPSPTSPHLTLLSLHADSRRSGPTPPPPQPPQRHSDPSLPRRPRPSYASAAPGGVGARRDDCWTDAATSALIDAWGRRFLDLDRGNLKAPDWQAVAVSVNRRHSPKSDAQCKNRIDTLKKKYKAEKSKPSSSWHFFASLDALLGPNSDPSPPPSKISSDPRRPLLIPHVPQRRRSNLLKSRVSPPSARDSGGDVSGGTKALPPATEVFSGFGDVAEAVMRFGEVFERVEMSRLKQVMELEKERMVFVAELELQRMQFYMKTQMEISQLRDQSMSKKRRGMNIDVNPSGDLSGGDH